MTTLERVAREDVRARLRPSAVVALGCWEACLGLSLGTAVASVASAAYGRHPDGDAPLFAEGGLAVLDLLRHAVLARGPVLTLTLLIILLARFAGVLPAAYVFTKLAFAREGGGAPSARASLERAVAAAPASLTVTLLSLPIEGVLLGLGIVLGARVSQSGAAHLQARTSDLLGIAIVGLALLATGMVGIVGDVARAAVVRNESTGLDAARAAIVVFARRPVFLAWSYAWRALAACVPVALAAWLATRIGGRGGSSLVVLAAFHQIVIGVRVAIRVSWMAETLRAVG